MPIGPAANYLVKFNDHILPGYCQRESFDSSMNIAQHQAPYADGSLSEQTGLQNKVLPITMKVWEQDYLTVTDQIQLAATMVRSKRDSFAPLYIQHDDRHYEALVQTIRREKSVPSSVRLGEYEVTFECKPWLVRDTAHTISGVGFFNTDQVGRTIDDGGWTPTRITVTGTNVTISGYTAAGDFAGFVSVSGAVSSLIIDSDAFTATIGGVNKNNLMLWADYRTYVGPEKTHFVVTGASSCSIEYNDRWYL